MDRSKAEQWRDRAEKYRVMANECRNNETRIAFIRLAASCETTAETVARVERRLLAKAYDARNGQP